MPTTTDNNSILAILQIAEKAWAKGGGMGASSGLGGRGGGAGHGVSKPGSRGGKFWITPSGHVEYGAKPSGARGKTGGAVKKPQAVARHTNSAHVAANRAAAAAHRKPLTSHGPALHPHSLAAQRLKQTRMLEELMKVHKTGKDPHGNKLDPKQLAQVNSLITALRIQTHPIHNQGVGKKKEIAQEINVIAAAHLPFTVFKDKDGQYRWVGVSSSAAQDADGETVSLKALTEDVARKDISRDYGNLNWWHTNIKIGKCDFNAMDGPLLVESGTFDSNQVAEHIGKAIKNGKFLPGISLEFEHGEPGPQVLPGRVFKTINKKDRALLPSVKASNLLTNFKVYSLKSAALAEKEVKEMIPKEKLEELERILPPELLAGLLEGNQTAIKMAIAANHSFKELSPAAVAEPPVEVVAPEPAPVVVEPPVVAPVVNEVVAETETEDEPVEIDAAAMFDNLSQAVADKVLAALAATSATSTKEVNDVIAAQTLALKENTGALNKVVTENVALKARLDALEGNLPAAVRARVTQQPGISAKQLSPEHAGIVTAEKNVDPYLDAASRMMQTIPRG